MKRGHFLQQSAALATAAGVFPSAAHADALTDPFAPTPGPWRSYELLTHIELPNGRSGAQAWVPLPDFSQPNWVRTERTQWKTDATTARIMRSGRWGTAMLHAQWAPMNSAPTLELRNLVSIRDRAIDFATPGAVQLLSPGDRKLFTSATAFLPTDGIVRITGNRITAGSVSDVDAARRIYLWVVANTYRDPNTLGCGRGDVKAMLETGNLGGKCADINALYVALARASGIPARDLYGIRVSRSNFGYTSLGANAPDITHAQHCRAEVHLAGYGWVPVDPADVRKVMLEEPPGNLAANDPKVADARQTLFGAWESNWIPYNDGHDVELPGSGFPPVAFLMYPQAAIGTTQLDCLKAADFAYTITARELDARTLT